MATVQLTNFNLYGFCNDSGEIQKLWGFDAGRSLVGFGKAKILSNGAERLGYELAQIRPGATIKEQAKRSKGYGLMGTYLLNASDGRVFGTPSQAATYYGQETRIMVNGKLAIGPKTVTPQKSAGALQAGVWATVPLARPGQKRGNWSL